MACDLAVVSGMAFEAAMVRGSGICTVYGLNTLKLVQDMEQAIQNGVKGLVSFGTAAGLSPSLHAGSIVIARQVGWHGKKSTADAAWVSALTKQLPEAICADILGVDTPLADAYKKSEFYRAIHAVAADMESHHVARIAHHYTLPFAVLRVVLDDAHCTLPPAALVATTAEGHVAYGKLLASLLKQPQQIPDLMRLATSHAKAKQSLLRCSDLLKGNLFGFVNIR